MIVLPTISLQAIHFITLAPLLLCLYVVAICFYRLYFARAAGIPGPFLAKITFWYELYHDVICRGEYVWKIKQMHEKYGPIVRINPEEVHINDGDYYDEVYTGATRKRDKWHVFARQTGWPESGFGTPNHDLHRIRRAALNPFFSKVKVRSLQPRIEKILDGLARRLEGFLASGEPLPMSSAYAAASNDIIMDYSFGWSLTRVAAPDFDPSFKEAGESGGQLGHLVKRMPWIISLVRMIPDEAQEWLHPKMAGFIRLNRNIMDHVFSICGSQSDALSNAKEATTIFHSIVSSTLPPQEKSPSRLWQDAVAVVVAGTLTTSTVLSATTFYLLKQPDTLRRLKEELASVVADPKNLPPSATLEKLPYLTAVVKEGLRLANGVATRLPRIPVDETLIYSVKEEKARGWAAREHKLRPGTPISMTAMLIHSSPKYFDDPTVFRPERWIEDTSGRLDKYLVPFSRGTRQCVGLNLAHAELYLALAKVFSQFGSREACSPGDKACLELFETVLDDLKIVGDGGAPMYRVGSKGIRVKVIPNCL